MNFSIGIPMLAIVPPWRMFKRFWWTSASHELYTDTSCAAYRVFLLDVQFKVDNARSGSSYLQLRHKLVHADMPADATAYAKAIYIWHDTVLMSNIRWLDSCQRLHCSKDCISPFHQLNVLSSRVSTITYRGSRPEVARKDSQTYVDVAVISMWYWVAIVWMKFHPLI